jgi:hypothetical protein
MKPKTLLNGDFEGVERKAPAPERKHFKLEDIETRSPLVITGGEIVKALNISAFTFRKWVERGTFDSIRLLKRQKGETYLYNKADFVEWLNEHFC